MATTTKKATAVNNSNSVAGVANVGNLAPVQVDDNTTTKGKVSAKFTLVDDALATEAIEKLDKNKIFAEVSDYFCPVKFDSTILEANLSPLVASGILSEDAKAKAIETAKREFMAAHESEINAAQNMRFAEVVAKLQENETLYKKVLTACNVTTLEESCYVDGNGNVMIFRANQCTDKEGNNRYQTATLKRTENGKEFSQPLYVELREQNTTNILLAIRYYASKQNATKTLLNKVTDYKRILTYVRESVMRAKDNGFTLQQVMNEVNEVFA